MTREVARGQPHTLQRRAVVAEILREIGDTLVVTSLGTPTKDAAAVGDRDLTVALRGAMGGSVPLALGLAHAQPKRRVLVIAGDGEMLMTIGSLATVGAMQPANLAIAVLDNERYGETGGQPTHTGRGADLAMFARGAGIARSSTVSDAPGLAAAGPVLLREPGPVFVAIKVSAEDLPLKMPPVAGTELRHRFRRAIGG
ncbi:MAG: aldehyde dehydrogenase [Alphaproteobacteria bacterium]|nr:aldehyde dehydrogenase [Alphaproteobacteria bacterium]